MTKIFILAGEASGDQLGASFIRAYKEIDDRAEFRGVGGPAIIEAGQFESLFPISDLSVMGIAEVLPRLPKLLKRMDQVVDAIHGYNPDIVITIDAPDFSFRIQKRVQKLGLKAKRIHYVAPTVWAWRPGRAKKIAKFLDGLICLFPFEPKYFEDVGLKSVAVGHPILHSPLMKADGARFRVEKGIDKATPVLGLLFGSRGGELERNAGIMMESAARIAEIRNGSLHIVVPTLQIWEDVLRQSFDGFPCPVTVTSDPRTKYDAFKSCDAALAVSGTVGLELAAGGIPHAILYRINKATYQIVKRLIKTPYAHLANILLQQGVVPEFIQDGATVDKIVPVLERLLNDPFEQSMQKIAFQMAMKKLQPDQNTNAADKAAAFAKAFIQPN